MKRGRILISVIFLVAFIFTLSSVVSAEDLLINVGSEGGAQEEAVVEQAEEEIDEQTSEKVVPDDETDKGSPFHFWRDMIRAGMEAGTTLTRQQIFDLRRNWSTDTVNLEIDSLVAIGVLRQTGEIGDRRSRQDTFEVLVTADEGQLIAINEAARGIVNRRNAGAQLGVDRYRLDDEELGDSPEDSDRKRAAIRAEVEKLTTGQVASVERAATINAAQALERSAELDFNSYLDENRAIVLPANAVLDMSPAELQQMDAILETGNYVLGILVDEANAQAQIGDVLGLFASYGVPLERHLGTRLAFRPTDNGALIAGLEDYFAQYRDVTFFEVGRLPQNLKVAAEQV